MEPEDLDLLYRIENDSQLWGVGATNVPYSRYLLHEYISNATGDIYTDRQVRLMIENEEGQVVGIADVMNFDPRHLRAELGIVIERAYRRQGYATDAIRQILDYARKVLHLHQLYAFVGCDNHASMELFSKVGFTREEELKDWLYDGKDYHSAIVMQYLLN
jgi:diamine N-acetyltransferase